MVKGMTFYDAYWRPRSQIMPLHLKETQYLRSDPVENSCEDPEDKIDTTDAETSMKHVWSDFRLSFSRLGQILTIYTDY